MVRLSQEAVPRLVLRAETARDLMSRDLVSLRADATLREAVALLTDRGYGAAPVIDAAGRPVGVLSRSDVLVHDRETAGGARVPPFYAEEEPAPAGGVRAAASGEARVRDLMTPVVFSVAPNTPAPGVVRELLDLKVHRLFVVDEAGVLVGVISDRDVLRHLGPLEA